MEVFFPTVFSVWPKASRRFLQIREASPIRRRSAVGRRGDRCRFPWRRRTPSALRSWSRSALKQGRLKVIAARIRYVHGDLLGIEGVLQERFRLQESGAGYGHCADLVAAVEPTSYERSGSLLQSLTMMGAQDRPDPTALQDFGSSESLGDLDESQAQRDLKFQLSAAGRCKAVRGAFGDRAAGTWQTTGRP